MKTFLITYDLIQPAQNYSNLHKAIEILASSYFHCLESVWIIEHNGPADVIRDTLRLHVDGNDKLLVTELAGEVALHGFSEKKMLFLKDFS